MKGIAVIIVVGLASCADPEVDLELVVPAQSAAVDMSCLQSVELYIDGANYPTDATDTHRSCVNVDSPATMADLPTVLRGQFQGAIPQSGLGGIEIYGENGKCDADGNESATDLLFEGAGDYSGDNDLPVVAMANLSCKQDTISAKLVDLFALVASPTHDCADATLADGTSVGASIGTYSPLMRSTGAEFVGDRTGGGQVDGAISIQGLDQVSSRACLAFDAGDSAELGSVSCALSSPPACATGAQHEVAVVRISTVMASVDNDLVTAYGGVLIGAVVSKSGATITPVAGATIALGDTSKGEVHYFDPSGDITTDAGKLVERDQASTGSSGIFVIYTGDIVSITATANGATQTTVIADSITSDAGGPAAAIIVMP